MIAIVVGLASLAVLVFAFLATKVWHWAHVTALAAFYFASLAYAILAARSLDTRLELQKKEYQAQQQLEQQLVLTGALERGASKGDPAISRLANDVAAAKVAQEQGEDLPSVGQLAHEVRLQNRRRGRVWRWAGPTGPADPATGKITIYFDPPQEQLPENGGEQPEASASESLVTLTPESIVYVFEQDPEERPEGSPLRHYIGEFRVDEVRDTQAVLDPLDQLELDPFAQERLLGSRGPWIIYEAMPADDRELFAGFDEETLRQLMPAGSIEEYLRDKTPTTPDDPLDRREPLDADGKVLPPDTPEDQVARTRYRRRLRDYALLLNELERERSVLVAREQASTTDLARLQLALEGAEKLEAYRRAELQKWQVDLEAVERDRAAIERHVAALQSQIANARQLLQATLEENARLASVRLQARGELLPIPAGSLDLNAL